MNNTTVSNEIAHQLEIAHARGLIECLEIRRCVTAYGTPLIYEIMIKLPRTTPTHIMETLTQYLNAKGCTVTHRPPDFGAITIEIGVPRS